MGEEPERAERVRERDVNRGEPLDRPDVLHVDGERCESEHRGAGGQKAAIEASDEQNVQHGEHERERVISGGVMPERTVSQGEERARDGSPEGVTCRGLRPPRQTTSSDQASGVRRNAVVERPQIEGRVPERGRSLHGREEHVVVAHEPGAEDRQANEGGSERDEPDEGLPACLRGGQDAQQSPYITDGSRKRSVSHRPMGDRAPSSRAPGSWGDCFDPNAGRLPERCPQYVIR